MATKSLRFRMTPRDFAILEDIGKCGALTAEQIAVRHFGVAVVRKGKSTNPDAEPVLATFSNAQRRLKGLREEGMVKRVERYQRLSEGRLPYLYMLTRRGAEALAEERDCSVADLEWRQTDKRIRPNYIEHLIWTNDIRLGVERALRTLPNVALVAWKDELALTKIHGEVKIPVTYVDGRQAEVSVLPDAHFVIRDAEGVHSNLFVEIDRGSEPAEGRGVSAGTWQNKVRNYLYLFTSDWYKNQYGRSGRLLCVTTSPARLANLFRISQEAGAKERFWFSTYRTVTEPSITPRAGTNGGKHERTYDAVMPNILDDKLWLVANSDGNRHSILEHVSREHPPR
jgi:hypothetical protein